MKDFSDGIVVGVNEAAYQAALRDCPNGFVLSLNRGRKGGRTLHTTKCRSVNYDLEEKQSPVPQTHRSGKIVFSNRDELVAYLDTKSDLSLGDLNRCSFCSPR